MSLSAAKTQYQSPSKPAKSNEAKLLEYFAGLKGATVGQIESSLFGQKYFFYEAGFDKHLGYGRGFSRSQGCIKAVAECLERKFMCEAFQGSLKSTPRWNQTSNGFAVHFTADEAIKSSIRETIERHILQMTYFRDGWAGFNLLEQTRDGEFEMQRIVSRYSCSGYRGGIVIVRSEKFSGIAMGYICDLEDGFESSVRWRHAYFEAVDKISPMLKTLENGLPLGLQPIDKALFDWFLNVDHKDLKFSNNLSILKLPDVFPVVRTFDLSVKWDLDFPFFAAHASGEDILPLVVSERMSKDETTDVIKLLQRLGLPPKIPSRNPIL